LPCGFQRLYNLAMRRGRFQLSCAAALGATVVTAATAAATSHDPVIRLDTADQARAKQVVLRSHDFPSEWRYHPIALRGVSIDATCPGIDTDLSTLVVTGQTGSRGTRSYGSFSRQDVVTEAFLFASPSQARMIQARLPTAFMRQCLGRSGAQDGHGGHIDSVSRLELKAKGVGVRAYRVVVTAGQKSTWGDYLFLQAHRTWVTIFYTSTPQRPALEERFLAVVAARMR